MKFKFRDYVGGIIICLLSMFAVIGTVHGQNRLNVDLAVPNLAVENGAKTFRVRINKTATACNDGKLRIKLPNGFKYVSGSAKIDGNNPASEDLTDDALTLPLGSIGTLGTGADYIEVKFDVEAFCPALLVSSTDRYVDYTLTGCGVPTEGIKGKSNVINLLAAVLNISVTPALEQAVVGQTLIRTITIKNSGTGDIKKFKIPVNYGTGITRLPTAEQTTLPQGITYDDEAKSYFYDGDFVSGASLTITEKVKINGCVGLASTYEVTYGSDCVRHTGDKTSVAVQIDDSKRPRVVVSDESAPQTVCMGGTYTHIWKIKNTGNAPASLVELGINASTIEGNVDVRGGNGATAVAGSVVRIDVLAPDEELTVTFTQRYTAPTSNADCATAPTEYTTASTGYTLSYKHIEGCIGGKTPEYASSATTKQSLTLAFNGDNVGEEDIIGGMPYHADFKIGTWSFPEDGLDKDAYLEIVIDLSADLFSSDLSTTLKLFNGANDVGVTINKANDLQYKIRLDRSALIQSTEGNWRLKFPLTLTCPTTAGNPFYKITTTLFNCGNAITFACETVGLSAVCPEGDCPNGGMQKGTISLERITLGLEDKNNDGIPDNANSASDLGESIRSFVGGDIIEISQQGIVGAPQNDATYLWKSGGRFEVTVADPNLGMVATGLFGKVEVTRGATVFPFDNIPVQSANGKFFIALPSGNIATGFDGFVNGDKVIASLQLKATKANEKTELKRFMTSYGLYHESDLNTLRSCGNLDKVSGYYAATELTVGTVNGTYNIPTCESGQEGAGLKIDFAIDGDNYRNALFPDEFREITKPKTITFNVSAGLTMTGYRVELQGNGAVPAFIDVNTLSISGATHTIDAATLANHLRALKGNRIEGAIDEGFTFVVRPIVTPNCNAGLEETITIDATVDGSFNLGATNHIGATDVAVASQTLKYKTDNDKLEVNVLQVSTVSYTNEAKWLLKVSNRSEFREFQNFWLGKTAGTVNISSVKEVKSLTDMTEVTSGITESGGVYNLKSVNAEQSRYFLITASVVNCADGSIEFAYGNDCKGVPSTVADAICKTNYAETLKFVLVDPILQTTVIDDPGAEQIPICEPITYVVEINNAGGEAKELKLNIKMASFLNYVGVGGVATEAKMSTVYTTRPDPSAITFSQTITGVTFDPSLGEAVITIPANLVDNSLQNAERFYLQFQLQVANCEFKSGQRITLTPAAKNFCGTDIEGAAKILEAGTDRIILKGAPTQEPIVDLTGAVSINLTPALGDPLTATYTAVITNVGSDDSGFAITGTASSGNPSNFVYKYALKLPDGWEIDNPQSFVAANKLTYTSVIDPVKGYIFEFNEDLNFQEKITLTGKLKFTGALGSIECNNADFTFGDIQQEVYTNFTPEGNCPIATSPACAGMELLTKTHSTPFNLSKISPTGAAEMAFCEDLTVSGISTPTLANVTPLLGRTGILEWYRDAGLTQSISNPSAEILVTETDYYAANRLVEGSDCLSAPLKVRVYLEKTPTANAGADQLKYNNGTFTLAANKPDRSESTNTGSSGKWTVVPAGAATFVDNTLYNTNVTIPVGTIATLTWTVTNSCGVSVSDEIVVTSMTAKLTIEKTASAVIEKTGDGRHSAGDLIEYRFKVTNSGQAVIKAPIRIIDNKLSGWAAPGKIVSNADLAPGDILEVSEVGEYIVSLTDMNAGKVENIAKATGTTPKGIGPNGGETNGVVITSPDGKTTTPLIPETGLSLIKSITAIGGNSKAGDKITYTFVVTNTGNVTIKDLKLTDVKLGLKGSGSFEPSTIDPGKSATAEKVYFLVQEDLDRGYIENTATAAGADPKGKPVEDVSDTGTRPDGSVIDKPGEEDNDGDGNPNNDPTILDLVQIPGIKLEKKGEYKGDKDRAKVGDKVEYTFVVTNIGNITLKDVVLTDTEFSGKGNKLTITGPDGNPSGNTVSKLSPKATLTYKAIYSLAQEDIDAGKLINQASVTANPKVLDPTKPLPPVTGTSVDPNNPTEPNGKTVVSIPQKADVSVEKSASRTEFSVIGDNITYTIKVTNTGNVTLTDLVFSDTMFPNWTPNPKLDKLEPGKSQAYTIVKTITQDILTAGADLFNEVTVTAKDPNGKPVEDDDNVTVPYKKNVILASPDTYGPFNGRDEHTTRTVLENDKLNAVVVLSGQVILTPGIVVDKDKQPIQGIVMNVDGTISITKGVVPAGTYTYPYTICEALNTTNCSSTVATIVIIASPIKAEDDKFGPINGKEGGKTSNVLDNDKLNTLKVDPKDVKITVEKPADPRNPGDPVPTLDPNTGKVTINPETPAGEYKIEYKICEVLNPTNCDNAVITITVVAPEIEAIDDAVSGINGKEGKDNVINALTNDKLNGVIVDPSEVTLKVGGNKVTSPVSFKDKYGKTATGVVLKADGSVDVKPETAAGKYTLDYSICEVLNPTNCDVATITVTVDAAPIKAEDDTFGPINGKDKTVTPSVLENDKLNDKKVDPKDVKITVEKPADPRNPGEPVPTLDPNTGKVTINPETPAGEYKIEYKICQVLNPTNCDNAVITITVVAPEIEAIDDAVSGINGKEGKDNVINALTNDKLNGVIVDPSEVTLKVGGNKVTSPVSFKDKDGKTATGVVLKADGNVDVKPETAAGKYTLDYSICEVLNPTNCDVATITVTVDAAPIKAEDDTFGPINGKDKTVTPSVLENDKLNDKKVDPKDVKITVEKPADPRNPGEPVPTLDPNTGKVTINPETPAGEYKIEYKICEVLNPTNCDNAVITITVVAPEIEAIDDAVSGINGKEGKDNVINALTNDKLNGVIVDPSEVTLKVGGNKVTSPVSFKDKDGKTATGVVLKADGNVDVKPETAAGKYTLDYSICEVLNPTNCDVATITVTVDAAPIKAEDDTFGPINGKDKTATPSVLENDKLNDKKVDPKDVKITVEKPADPRNPGEPVPTLDPNTGKVTINPETPAGEYKIEYKICEVLNPTNCDNAVITITVVAPEIKAVDDEYGPYNGKDGGETASVFENDLLNKVKLNPNDIELTAGVPVNEAGEEIRGLIMNKNGKIKVEKETAAGKYYYPYKITEKLNPDNFDDAVAIVTVIAAPIKANDDRYQVNGKNGGTTPTVIENDKLNGKTIDPKEIELKIGKPTDLEGKPTTVVTMNPDGTITVAPNTPKGTYLYPYTICEVLNPTNCSSAVAKIEILPAPIVATDDSYKVEWTRESVTTASVLLNDKYNSKPVDLNEVTLLPGASSHPGLSMNPDGTITIAPSTRPGTYTYPYTICEVLNPTNCSTAVATIVIEASNVFIPNTFTPNGDGVNDKFEIVGVENFDNVSVTIVNRWGNEVYRNDSYKNEWNGSGLNEGTYYYIVTLRKGTTETVHKGWVLIKTR